METPRRSDGTVAIDGLLAEDAQALVECHDADTRWALGDAGPMTLEAAAKIINKSTWQWRRASPIRRFAIRLADAPDCIGWGYLNPSGRGPYFMTIVLHPDHRNAHLGRKATALLCRYAFDDLNADEIEVETRMGHSQSQRMALAVGFEAADQMRFTVTGNPVTVGRLTARRWRTLNTSDPGS